MKRRILLTIILITALMLACNLQRVATPTDSPDTLPPDSGITLTPSTEAVVVPSATPTITLSPTPSVPMVTPKADGVNCRYGPGTAYIILGALPAGSSVPILGKTSDEKFWLINNPTVSGQKCFVAASVTNTSGNTASVPFVDIPPSLVTNVTANNPANINVAGCMGPIQSIKLKGLIEVNGPVTVVWHFETQQGGVLPSYTSIITEFGTTEVNDNSYTPPLVPGTYWVHLVITSPASMVGVASYTISCP